jgi:4-amino-4-deoxy-L-arabinose transferase-like glycosyltransferase
VSTTTTVTDAAPESPSRSARARWWIDASVFGVVALLLRVPAYLAPRSLIFDDGVYAASALAMRAGAAPFRAVFSSQGPLFLPLIWLGDLVGFRTLDSPRLLSIVSGIVATVAIYAIARHITTRGASLLAAGLFTTSGGVLWVTGPANSDGPSLAFSLVAVALAMRYRERPRVGTAVLVGLAAGAALAVKLIAGPAVLVAGLVVLGSHRRVRDAAVAAGVGLVTLLLTPLPWGYGRVWDQSVAYHTGEGRELSYGSAAWKVLTTLWHRDLAVLVALGLAAAWYVFTRITRGRPAHPDRTARVTFAMLVLWVVLLYALLVWEPALWRAHVAHVVPPLVLLATLRPPPWPVLAVAALVVAPFWYLWNQPILVPKAYSGDEATLVTRLRDLPRGALVISDDPGWVWRAGKRTPAAFADVSFLRIDAGQITGKSLASGARPADVCAVVASDPNHFLRFPGLPDRLEAEGYELEHVGTISLYVRPDCAPGGR